VITVGFGRDPDADQRLALRAPRPEPGVLGRHRGRPVRSDGGQVVRREVPVVGTQVVERVTDVREVVAQQARQPPRRRDQQ